MNQAAHFENGPVPVGVWIRMRLPQCPHFVGFTYIDPEAGLSARGAPRADSDLVEHPVVTVRPIPFPGATWEVIVGDEALALGIPPTPSWLAQYGPQPTPGTLWGSWRSHPRLQGRFHAEYPDDIQVIVHDGGSRLSNCRPELIWVRVTGGEGNLFKGRALNRPAQLTTVSAGEEILFIAPAGGKYPLRVTAKYLAERADWIVHPCNRCGLSELFDAPSDLIRVLFPQVGNDATVDMFSVVCGACGGCQVVQHKTCVDREAVDRGHPRKKWWQWWKK